MHDGSADRTLSSRQREIVALAQRDGFVAVEALAQRFEVTPQTVRRDVNTLCAAGLLARFHGGAGLASSVENVAYDARQVMCADEKRRIAELAARQIPDRASLFINLGTTPEAVARALAGRRALRIITNNLNVAWMLRDNPDIELSVAGGVVRTRDAGITGEATIDFIRQFKVDYAIIGISGIDIDGALLEFDYHEVRVSSAMMANARQVLLVADHSKFGRNALVRLGHVSQLSALVTDAPPPRELAEVLEAANVSVHVAGDGAAGRSAAPAAPPAAVTSTAGRV